MSNGDEEMQPYTGGNQTHRRGQPGLRTQARASGSVPALAGGWGQGPAPLHSSKGKPTPVPALAGSAAQTQESTGGSS